MKMAYPEEFTDGSMQLVTRDGKKYFKVVHYKLSHYTYEEVKHEKIDLPPKLPDIYRSDR